MEPTSTNTPAPQPAQTPPPQPHTGMSKKKLVSLWIVIGLVTLLVIAALAMNPLSKKQPSPTSSNKKQGQSLTVGSTPYTYACSVVTVEDFNKAFGLSGPGTIGTITAKNPLRQATNSNETDLTKLAPYGKNGGYPSTCELVVLTGPDAKTFATIDTTVSQFSDKDEAGKSVNSIRRFHQRDSQPALPTLPSFPVSVVRLPSAEGASHTIEATAQHGSMTIELSYMMADSETADATLAKIDAFAKLIAARADNTSAATKPSTLDGHTTIIGKPFINTCTNIGLTNVAQKLGGISLRPDEVTHVGQYGALAGSHASQEGVLSSCRLTFGTAEEATKRQQAQNSSKSSSSSASARTLYPHTLLLAASRYGSADEAKSAISAKRDNQHKTIANIQDVSIGDGGYKLHNETTIPNFTGGQPTVIVEDAYTLRSGSNLVVVSLQQMHRPDTAPVTVTDARIQDVYGLYKTMLSK